MLWFDLLRMNAKRAVLACSASHVCVFGCVCMQTREKGLFLFCLQVICQAAVCRPRAEYGEIGLYRTDARVVGDDVDPGRKS